MTETLNTKIIEGGIMPYQNNFKINEEFRIKFNYFILGFLLILSHSIIYCQENIITNGEFENVSFEYNLKDSCYKYENWNTLHLFPNKPRYGIPDYLKFTEFYKPKMKPENALHFVNIFKPYEGNSSFVILTPYLRNLYQTKLKETMCKGILHKVSFKFKISFDGYSESDVIKRINKGKIGILFNTKEIEENSKEQNTINKLSISIKPDIQLIINSEGNLGNWVEYSTTIMPEDDYNYIILGNYGKILESAELLPYLRKGIIVLIDDLSISKIGVEDSIRIEENFTNNTIDYTTNRNSKIIERLDSLIALPNIGKKYEQVYIADSLLLYQNYSEAFKNYKKYFLNYPQDFTSYLSAQNIGRLARINTDELSEIKERWEELKSQIITSFINKVDSIFIIDQEIRKSASASKNIQKQDSVNFDFIKHFMNDNKIGISTLGHNSYYKLLTLLFHFTRYITFIDFIPQLNKLLETDEITPRNYAMLIDEYYKVHFSNNWHDSYFHTNAYLKNNQIYITKKYSFNELYIINMKRNLIGLESINLPEFKLQMQLWLIN